MRDFGLRNHKCMPNLSRIPRRKDDGAIVFVFVLYCALIRFITPRELLKRYGFIDLGNNLLWGDGEGGRSRLRQPFLLCAIHSQQVELRVSKLLLSIYHSSQSRQNLRSDGNGLNHELLRGIKVRVILRRRCCRHFNRCHCDFHLFFICSKLNIGIVHCVRSREHHLYTKRKTKVQHCVSPSHASQLLYGLNSKSTEIAITYPQ